MRIGARSTAGNGNIVSATGLPRYLGVRLFSVRDLNDNIVPDTYVGTLDLTPGNHDFNDVVVYFQNIQPAGTISFPVELLSFEATNLSEAVQLDWKTVSEENVDRFRVLRSMDANEFEEVGEVTAVGNSQEQQTYQLLDTQPLEGRSYYQLESVDLDGTTSRSQIVEVYRQTEGFVRQFYPIPADQVLNLEFGVPNPQGQTLTLTCYNQTGQTVSQETRSLDGSTLSINTSRLTDGMYVLMATLSSGQRTYLNFLVQH